uniref:Protein-L-isoaspartate(D-aspartate) O-methyltransferase n=1 Tax=Trieres chinensis TaxID=1514140 RepID=A0A7S1Z0L7_TRICV
MAWRSGGATNDEMVDNLTRFGVISSESVERGFRSVDRRFFVPKGNEDTAHSDQPLKVGNVHISAPHIYGSALEALELRPNSSLSFLNVGSGTGYLSCIVAEILGPKSLNFGVEIHEDVVQHCNESIENWRRSRKRQACGKRQSGSRTASDTVNSGPHLQIIHGNGLNVASSMGESVVGFDRIYVGAAIERTNLPSITKLLSPGGILVGPVDDELMKVVRIGPLAQTDGASSLSNPDDGSTAEEDTDNESSSNINNEFTQQVLSGVRFAPLLTHPVIPTVIPARGWAPDRHRYFPDTFQRATTELLMCSNSVLAQPPPRPRRPTERINAASMLPRVIWIEILSFTHRKWFEPEKNETEYLKKRLLEEQANAARAQQARLEAEARCHVAERERDVYRLLARRWQSRLHLILQQQRQEPADDLVGGEETAAILGLGAMLRRVAGEEEGEDEEDTLDHEGLLLGVGMENNLEEENENGMDDAEEETSADMAESDDRNELPEMAAGPIIATGAKGREEDDSVVMDDIEGFGEEDPTSREVRTVSISSDDL